MNKYNEGVWHGQWWFANCVRYSRKISLLKWHLNRNVKKMREWVAQVILGWDFRQNKVFFLGDVWDMVRKTWAFILREAITGFWEYLTRLTLKRITLIAVWTTVGRGQGQQKGESEEATAAIQVKTWWPGPSAIIAE